MEYEVPRIDVRGATNYYETIQVKSVRNLSDTTNSFNRSGSGQKKAIIVALM
jgi:hypothetical protein